MLWIQTAALAPAVARLVRQGSEVWAWCHGHVAALLLGCFWPQSSLALNLSERASWVQS